jgi:acyl carrier protein
MSTVNEVSEIIVAWISSRCGVEPSRLQLDKSFSEIGLDSIDALEMAEYIEDQFKVHIDSTLAWSYPDIISLATYIVSLCNGLNSRELEVGADNYDECKNQNSTEKDLNKLSDMELVALINE